MQFKTTLITGVFLLLISSLSIAKPISQNHKTSQKIEQTRQQKPNFFQKIVFKKTIKKIKKDKVRASSSAKISLWLGILSFPLIFIGVGPFTALAAIVIGISTLKREQDNRKSRSLANAGITLGAIVVTLVLFALAIIWSIDNFPLAN